MDISSLFESLRIISSQTDYEILIPEMMDIILEQTGADIGMVFVNSTIIEKDGWILIAQQIRGEQSIEPIDKGEAFDFNNVKLQEEFPLNVMNYCIRTGEALLIHNPQREETFFEDQYLNKNNIRAFMSIPVINPKNSGLIFLGSSTLDKLFKDEILKFVKLLFLQFMVSLENALIYKSLENSILVRDNSIEQLKKYIQMQRDKHPELF